MIADNTDLAGVTLPEAKDSIAKVYVPGEGFIHSLGDFPVSDVGGMNLNQLAHLARTPSHPLAAIVDTGCSRCGAPLKAMRLFAYLTACDSCREKADTDEKMHRAKVYWEAICPLDFRDTDTAHPDFPKTQFEELRAYDGATSLFFIGPTRSGKTRLAMLLLKRCLWKYAQHVGILWPEELKQLRANFTNRMEWVQKWGRFDLLLWDDALLTGAQDERIVDGIKDLLDYRMRWKRANIFTSQIGGADFSAQGEKFDNGTPADRKRIEALLARLREVCRVVVFAPAVTANAGEEAF